MFLLLAFEIGYVQNFENGFINWTRGFVKITAVGKVSQNQMEELRLIKRQALSQLETMVLSLPFDFEHTLGELASKQRILGLRIKAVVKGALEVDRRYMSDGTVEMDFILLMWKGARDHQIASLSEALWGRGTTLKLKKMRLPVVKSRSGGKSSYTGIVFDATGTGLIPSFCPRIYDEKGRLVYGPEYIEKKYLLAEGVACYISSIEDLKLVKKRVGENPLVIKVILAKKGRFPAAGIISGDDAQRILSSKSLIKAVKHARVVFVVE